MAAEKKNRLGKGLDALFQDNSLDSSEVENELPLADIEPDREQPRSYFDDESLAELADSIAQHGVLQPILVRPKPDGGYKIVAGERRWRASRLAGRTTIPAIVRNLSQLEAMTFALIENLQREDLNPVDEALGLKQLMDLNSMTQEQAARQVGRSRSSVANALRLLSLPEEALGMLREGRLTVGHAKAILSLPDPAQRASVARQVAEEGITVREAEKRWQNSHRQERIKLPLSLNPEAVEVEKSLSEALGVEVRVKYKDGSGTLSVDFYSREQLYDFANRLGSSDDG
ncbi:MAG: ParB/RepB/Spo0J family partition protein [Oscillospiraceae bacterium]|nr:ParB/RepB/Spo0J family partition protein [Oscillospiraceae bacterium]